MRFNPKVSFQSLKMNMGDIYSTRNDESKGRLISLGSALVAAFYNVFITGIFYTGFLSMYDISITGVGIISFIPYIGSCFSLFSSSILERIKKRKWVLLGSKIYFYAMYIIATNLMPIFVKDPNARLTWFIIILFLAYSVNALFNPGFTTWFYRFYPADNERRTRYIVYNQIFSTIMSSIILLISGLLTDAVAGSEMQNTLILGLRYFAFVLVLVDVAMQACAREYPYPKVDKANLGQVFILPFKYRKFLFCMILMFAWNFNSNLNNGLWNYHLLNHLDFSYTILNALSVVYTIILLCTTSTWRKILRRYSWVKTFGLGVLLFVPSEFLMFAMTPGRTYSLYIPATLMQNLMSVGINLAYSNILYMNLPEENSTAHIAFHMIGCNLFAFLGMMTGTLVTSITGDSTIPFLGMQVYAVQFTTLMRAAFMTVMGLILIFKWRSFTRDEDIRDVEEQERVSRELKAKMAQMGMPARRRIALPWKK